MLSPPVPTSLQTPLSSLYKSLQSISMTQLFQTLVEALVEMISAISSATRFHFFSPLSCQILELQMNDFKYHYLFTSFDLETFEMEDFRYNFVNITAFRLVDTNDVFVKETLKEMEHFGRHHRNVKFKRSLAVEVKRRGKFFVTGLSRYYDATSSCCRFVYNLCLRAKMEKKLCSTMT